MKIYTSILAATALFSVAACGQPTAEEYDDVAAGVSALVADNPGSETTAIRDGIDGAMGEVSSQGAAAVSTTASR